jgi:hypothetical protein
MGVIEGYASAISVSPGQDLAFHVRDEASAFTYQIHRRGAQEELVAEGSARAGAYETPERAYEIGCRWPPAFTLTIPDAWRSGLYVARLSSAAGTSREIYFVVRARDPGQRARVLFTFPTNTAQAYNAWGGKSLYTFNSSDRVASPRVSFDRPTDELVTAREIFFIRWLEASGHEVEYCASLDLHRDPGLLARYQLVLSVGHDEYWSRAMRDNVEAFVARGGNAAFFSGNTSFWQVRFEDDGRTMVGYKSDEDPVARVDPGQTTLRWADALVDRPENTLTGVGFRSGAGWWDPAAGARPAADYTVHFGDHWVFAGANLRDGGRFGGAALIIGYETDAAQFTLVDGVPQVTGADGTPRNAVILASADLTSWGPGGRAGWVTLGFFRNRGLVLTVGTTDWAYGLVPGQLEVQRITANVLSRLSRPDAANPPVTNADFTRWEGSEPSGWERAGAGVVKRGASPVDHRGAVLLDAATGSVSLHQPLELLQWRSAYRVSAWVKASAPGATLRLVSARTSKVIAVAESAVPGPWQEITALGQLDDEGPLFPARVELQVSTGTATFTAVRVEAI